jgi:two-component system LytT family sensor kinase
MEKRRLILLHVLFWVVVFMKYNFVRLSAEGLSINFDSAGRYLNSNSFLIAFGYLTISMFAFYGAFIVSGKILKRRNFLYGTALVMVMLAGLVVYRAFIELGILKPLLNYDNYRRNPALSWKFFVPNVIFYYWDFLMCGIAWGVYTHWQSAERSKREEEAINKSMQLQFLQSQLNPHFLFNTINDIYALALKKSDQTPETLMQLSGLLRYALYDNKEMTVPLQKELTYINNYLNLQRTGYENLFYVDLEIEGDPASWQIPPMLLLPFVENACKHGVTNEKNNPVVIRICSGTKKLSFTVNNQIRMAEKDAEGGIGIGNIRKRLELLYPGKHVLLVKEDNDIFTVEMEIDK